MAAIPPINIPGVNQPNKGFVHQGCGLKSVARSFAAEAAACNLAQVRHQQFEECGFGVPISRAPLLQKLSDFARVACHPAPPVLVA